jgi:LysM repeat protein
MFKKVVFLLAVCGFYSKCQASSLETRSAERLNRIQELFQKLREKPEAADTDYVATVEEEKIETQSSADNYYATDEGTELLLQTIDNWHDTENQKLAEPLTAQSVSENNDTETQPPVQNIASPLIGSNIPPVGRAALFRDLDYVVRPGDSLLLIARRLYMNPKKYQEIIDWNGLKSDVLRPGQKLTLKDVPVEKIEEWVVDYSDVKALYPPDKYYYRVYKVRSGDSLSGVAQRMMGTQKEYLKLAAFNGLDADKFLYVGQKLIVPLKK